MISNVDNSMQKYRGLSTDTKPAAAPGSEFFEMDTGKTYLYDAEGTQWTEQPASGGGGGSVGVQESDVNFIDYDGTVVAAYSAADFANLTALPANPSHDGLTSQGWNWTLANAKTYVASYGELVIGQMYVTNDGKTKIYCTFANGRLAPCLGIGVNGEVKVDWGDGSETDTLTGSSLTTAKSKQHTYASKGDYIITLTVVSGSFAFFGTTTSAHILKTSSNQNTSDKKYAACIKKIEIGTGANLGDYAFSTCYNLTSVTIPSSVTSIGKNVFYFCYALKSITIPNSVTSIGNSFSYYCYNLTSVSIPSGVTSIGTYAFCYCNILKNITIPSSVASIGSNAFQYCYNLKNITIPSGVTSIESTTFSSCATLTSVTIPSSVASIGGNAFSSCSLIKEYHLLPTSPPSLSNTNAFSNIQSDCVIYVPRSEGGTVLAAYKAAQNWSTYASYMEEEPA